jgi:TRAP-type mannitol/chloroaromatic compound transport system permease large subunit
MSPASEGSIVLVATLLMLVSGIPVAFGLGAISIIFLLIFQGFSSMHVVAETFYAGLDEFTLVAIPMFVMMGAAIGSSPAGKDLYEALDRWLYRLPGGLVISNLGACAIFAALTGSSPACCAAIGKMGIPEMRRRGYPDEVATGSICAGGTLGILIPPCRGSCSPACSCCGRYSRYGAAASARTPSTFVTAGRKSSRRSPRSHPSSPSSSA